MKAKRSTQRSPDVKKASPAPPRPKPVAPVPALKPQLAEREKPSEPWATPTLDELPERPRRPLTIVGIGASAGGLEAFTQLLQNLPTDTGMGFVLLQHLGPAHTSALPELLAKATTMPVLEVQEGMKVAPNHVYVITPNVTMTIARGELKLVPRELTSAPHRVIDTFFKALAEDQKNQSIGVILSGTATDGTLGLEAIKAEGGITFAQDEKSARYDGMPRNAIASGCVDFILTPQEIARELGQLARHPYIVPKLAQQEEGPEAKDGFKRILAMFRPSHGVDFTAYKASTLRRRVNRRMALNKIERLQDYQKLLRDNHVEAEALFQDMLINVTSFFRDPGAFEVLEDKVFPKLIRERSVDEPVRIWVIGCSHGQEAYSLAMSYLECVGETRRQHLPAQIFATDLSDTGLERARTGFYPKSVAEEVSPERLRRFFMEVEGGYRINKAVRDMCLFARHNLLTDPPFSRLDLISCRNLLIYIEGEVQKKIMPMFHYALRPGGFLWLGSSESVGACQDLFALADRKHKIFSKKLVPFRHQFVMPSPDDKEHTGAMVRGAPHATAVEESRYQADAQREADRLLLAKYVPVGALINTEMEVLQFRGDTGPYLKPAPGKPTANLLPMLREGLLLPVRAAIQKAKKQNEPVQKTGLHVKQNGGFASVNVEVIPVKNLPRERAHFLVLFEPADHPALAKPPVQSPKAAHAPAHPQKTREAESNRNRRLVQELADTKDYSQSLTEQYDAAMEELQSANEEAQSANEELQSINEELETSKEELQATNEELSTVNQELQNRNVELGQFHNDLLNLLNSVGIPMVILGADLRIRRISPASEKILNVIPNDVGRSISDIKLKVEIPELEKTLLDVIENVTATELEVKDRDGRWYLLRIRPYKTTENKIEGAVLLLLDVAERQLLQRAKQQKELYQLADTLNRATTLDIICDAALTAATGALGAERAAIFLLQEGVMQLHSSRGLSDVYLQALQGRSPSPGGMLENQIFTGANAADLDVTDAVRRALKAEGVAALAILPVTYQNRLLGQLMLAYNIPHAFTDEELQLAHTIANQLAFGLDRKRAEEELHRAKDEVAQRASTLQVTVAERTSELSATNKQMEAFVYTIAHDLRAPLRAMQGFATMLLEEAGEHLSARARDFATRINTSARFMDTLLMDLLAFSQISQQQLEFRHVNLYRPISATLDTLQKDIEDKHAHIDVVQPLPAVRAHEKTLQLVIQNLVSNALKFVRPGQEPQVRIHAEERGQFVRLWVEDKGIGIEPEYLPEVWKIFTRVHGEDYQGTGIGLAIVAKGIERMGGQVGVASTPGQGSQFWFELLKP